MISLSDFRLEQFTIEIRFEEAYLLWDRAGSIGKLVTDLFGGVELDSANPGKVSFDAANRYKISATIDRASIIDHQPPAQIDDDTDATEKYFQSVLKELQIQVITRIGTRLIYRHLTETQDIAARLLLKGSVLKFRDEKMFGVEPGIVRPAFVFVSNDQNLGYRFGLSTQSREVKMNPPLNTPEITPQLAKTFSVQLDIDLYTTANVATNSFNLRGWLERVRRAVNRDTDKVLGSLFT